MASGSEQITDKASGCHMEWTQIHDLALCRELLVTNPFQEKYKTIKRAKLWDETAANLAHMSSPPFKKSLDKRAVQERYRLLTEKYKRKMAKERKESGTNPTMTELDVLVEELVEWEQTERDRRDSEDKTKNKKKEEGEEIRLRALEKLGDTNKRKKDQEESKSQKKTRRSSSDTIEYLREKSAQEFELKRQAIELEQTKQDEDKRKNDAFINMMLQQQLQQQQQQQQLMMMLAQQNQLMMSLLEKLGK